ncbi:MAG: hypothetical protein GTN76_04840 [Candidatus Aenigmarchaeota archaeon]|nr:hypothetical protein [Candidatus Aenigmarchaeota archaeon]
MKKNLLLIGLSIVFIIVLIGCGGGGGEPRTEEPLFSQADYQGEWNWNALYAGDDPQFQAWSRGDMTVDGTGNATGSHTLSSGASGQFSDVYPLSSSGIITSKNDNTYEGVMSIDKNLVVRTKTHTSGSVSLALIQRAGGTFSTGDMQGSWNFHTICGADDPNFLGWIRGDMTIDAAGNITSSLYHSSSGGTGTVPIGPFSVDASGIVTAQNDPTTEGVMSIDKDLVVRTRGTPPIACITVSLRAGGTFSTSDLEGTWSFQFLKVGDAPIQVNRWERGTIVLDANGNVTSGSYIDSDGSSGALDPGPFSISSSGVISNPDVVFRGTMSPDKNLLVGTSTDTDGYFIVIGVRR